MERLQLLRLVNSCQSCRICGLIPPPITYRGCLSPKYLFVGESPGTSEHVLKKPFVGPAGKVLDAMIVEAGLSKVGFTNVIWCTPRDKEDLVFTYSKNCKRWWGQIVDWVKGGGGKIIAVGTFTKETLTNEKINFDTWVYHPSHILRVDEIRRNQLWHVSVSRLKMIR